MYLLVGTIAFCLALTAAAAPQCRVSEKEFIQSGTVIFIVGDRNTMIPSNPAKDMDDHCKTMMKQVDILKDYGRCQKPFLKTVIGLLASGLKKETKARCGSKTWRKDFTTSMQCLRKNNITEDAHKCMDKVSSGILYAIENFPQDKQLQCTCCLLAAFTKCMKATIKGPCGEKAGAMLPKIIVSNVGEAFSFVCAGHETEDQCKTSLPVQIKQLEKIFESKTVPRRSIIGPILKVLEAQSS